MHLQILTSINLYSGRPRVALSVNNKQKVNQAMVKISRGEGWQPTPPPLPLGQICWPKWLDHWRVNHISQSYMPLLLPIFYLSPAFWQNPHMDFDKIYTSNWNYLARTTSHKLKITYSNITLAYETWLEWHYVAISMISGGSRSFAVGEGKLLFQSRKFQNGYGLYCLWRNKGSAEAPPLDPPL